MKGIRHERLKKAVAAILGVPDIVSVYVYGRRMRKIVQNGGQKHSWGPVYVVTIRRDKIIEVDLAAMEFAAPRWGYPWTSIFADSAKNFFLDVWKSGHTPRTFGTGDRRKTLDDYLTWRYSTPPGLFYGSDLLRTTERLAEEHFPK